MSELAGRTPPNSLPPGPRTIADASSTSAKGKRNVEECIAEERATAMRSPAHFRAYLQSMPERGSILAPPEEIVANWRSLVEELWDMARHVGGADHPPPNLPTVDSEARALSAIDCLRRWVIEVRKPPPPPPGGSSHPDGPDGGRWVWWKGKRHDVPKGVVFRLIEYMWGRDSAPYATLMDEIVWDSNVAPQTVRARVSEANNNLKRIGIPWKLTADTVSRHVTKTPA
ncbi:MAG: hypothetical protein U0792_15340 [Gemmataceae bacterium]